MIGLAKQYFVSLEYSNVQYRNIIFLPKIHKKVSVVFFWNMVDTIMLIKI